MESIALNVQERLTLAYSILPEKGGSFSEAIRVRQIRKQLELSGDEKAACGYEVDQQRGPIWNGAQAAENIGEVAFAFDEKEMEVIALGFKKFEMDGEVPTDNFFLGLYEKFSTAVEALDV